MMKPFEEIVTKAAVSDHPDLEVLRIVDQLLLNPLQNTDPEAVEEHKRTDHGKNRDRNAEGDLPVLSQIAAGKLPKHHASPAGLCSPSSNTDDFG